MEKKSFFSQKERRPSLFLENKTPKKNDLSFVYQPIPPYLLLARLNHMQGKVILQITVHNGKVISSRIIKSSDFPLLDKTAKYWVETHWLFSEGVNKVYLEEIIFELEDKKN